MSTAIEFNNISKIYRLGLVSTGTLSHDLKRWWTMNIRGKEDPYLRIGETNDRSTKGESEYVWALKDIDFKVEQGDVVGIIGKNGAGKSTLLKILSKVTAPTTGTIRARGRIGSLLEVGTGFHPEMTGRENIYMNGAILGMTKAEISKKLDEIVDFSGCERYIDTPVKRYSSGMMVRLGFAVAAHLDPEILVVDEVLAVGDAEFQKKAIGKMQDVSKGEGRTVLFVSHNMTAVKQLCHNGILLQNGKIFFSGDTASVIEKYLNNNQENATQNISNISNRIGSGKIRFKNICYLDASYQKRELFAVGETMIIEIELEKTETLSFKSSRIDVGINTMLGERVTWLSTFIYSDKINPIENKIRFLIPNILLNAGDYTINVYAETDEMIADWIPNIAKFSIEYHDLFNTGKIIPSDQGVFITNFKLI